jgi:hypothetical protein
LGRRRRSGREGEKKVEEEEMRRYRSERGGEKKVEKWEE